MNKKDILDKIKSLDGLSNEERAYLINLVNTKKKYGLVWEDKPEQVEEELRTKLPVLKEVKERAIINDTETEKHPNHILIEGDNLHALTALTFTHENKIDLIYIDPPYNTGNKDFIYNDHYVDKEDSYRHSKWLSFMHKRLQIAHKLLADDGVIFISIDDNEQAQLKLLCDSIFGEINSIGPIIQNKQNSKNDTINVQKNHEYIFIYRKKIQYNENKKVIASLTYKSAKKRPVVEEEGAYFYINDSITTRGEGGVLNARPNLGHTVYFNPECGDLIAVCDYNIEIAKTSNDIDKVYATDDNLISKGYVPIRPPRVRGKLGCWTWSLDKINEEKEKLIVTGKKGKYALKKRTFVSPSEVTKNNNELYYNSLSESNSRSIVDFSTNEGTETLNNVLGEFGKFNNPKNTEMLKYLIGLYNSKNKIIVLDFFAGSGTSLHATMSLNLNDGVNRQCILVTNNENNIAEEVTYKRNKRVIQGYKDAKGEEVKGLKNNNLRYYQCDFVKRTPILANKRHLTQLATELLCIKEDCYQLVSHHLSFSDKEAQIYTNGKGKYLVAIYYSRNQITVQEQLIEWVQAVTDATEKIRLYGFSPEKETLAEEFAAVEDKIEAVALPEAIYNAYLATFKTIKVDKKDYALTKASATETDPNN